jgi:septation ring formation regulator EzrA
MSQLIKLLQNYTEAQEEDMITVKRSLNQLHGQYDSNKNSKKAISPHRKSRSPIRNSMGKTANTTGELDDRMNRLEKALLNLQL